MTTIHKSPLTWHMGPPPSNGPYIIAAWVIQYPHARRYYGWARYDSELQHWVNHNRYAIGVGCKIEIVAYSDVPEMG